MNKSNVYEIQINGPEEMALLAKLYSDIRELRKTTRERNNAAIAKERSTRRANARREFEAQHGFIKLADTSLSTRAKNACKLLDVDSVGELSGVTEIEILRQHQTGRKTLAEIRGFVMSFGGA